MKFHRYIGDDGCQFFAQHRHILACPHFFADGALDFIRVFDHSFHAAVFLDKFRGRFFANTLDAGNIIYRVAHEAEYIDHLVYLFNIPFFANFFRAENFKIPALVGRFVDPDLFGDQLTIVFVGRYHIYFVPFFLGFFREGPDYIIGLVSIQCDHRYVQPFHDAFDIRYGRKNVFRCFLPVGLVVGEIGMPFRWRVCIETYGHVCGILVLDQLQDRIGKTKLGVGVASLAGDTRIAYECIVSTKNKGEGIEQE